MTTATNQQDHIQVGDFRPEDAEGIVSLVRAVYGDGYPIRLFYDPAAICAANTEGHHYPIVARTTAGRVVGVTHLYRSTPCEFVYEWGAGMVLKEYRNSGISNLLAEHLHNDFIPRCPHIETIFGEAVCNHPYLQYAVKTYHYVETAIEVALMPAEAYTTEKSAPGRVATLVGFRSCKPKPHRIYLPAPYDGELRWTYARLDEARQIMPSQETEPEGLASRIELTVFDFAKVARIMARATGADFRDRLDTLERQAAAKDVVVFQVYLNLAEPWISQNVAILRERGYFFGGAMIRWFDDDAFMMQKLLCPPDFDSIVLVSDSAKRLLEITRQDWERAKAHQSS